MQVHDIKSWGGMRGLWGSVHKAFPVYSTLCSIMISVNMFTTYVYTMMLFVCVHNRGPDWDVLCWVRFQALAARSWRSRGLCAVTAAFLHIPWRDGM